MTKCVPIRDMKGPAAFSRLVEESDELITVTKNRYDKSVVIKSADYEALQEEMAKSRLLKRIALEESEYADERYVEGPEFISQMREKYAL